MVERVAKDRSVRFLRTRATRASDNAAVVRAKAEAINAGSMQDYLRRLAADYERIASRSNELIRRHTDRAMKTFAKPGSENIRDGVTGRRRLAGGKSSRTP